MRSFNKKGYHYNQEFANRAQVYANTTKDWIKFSLRCKPMWSSLSDYEYFKCKWNNKTVVFWRVDGMVHSTIQ